MTMKLGKQVIFRIDEGSFEHGFPITLTIKENREICVQEVKGRLASAPEILIDYNNWQQAYCAWGKTNRWWRRQIVVPQQIDTNCSNTDSKDEVNNLACRFVEALNNWLDRSSLEKIKQRLLHTVGRNDLVNFTIKTDNQDLQKLPWELWTFLQEYYDNPEVALSSTSTHKKGALKSPVRILAILGSDEKIDIQTDWNILQQRLKNAKLTLLKKPPSDELVEKLTNQPWDIIFFAGHSSTHPSGNDGLISINEQEKLSTVQIKKYLKQVVRNGLKLVIFNSCDGLGLARQLEGLQIPHIIVMRQPIHDEVAQKFLNDFLTSFTPHTSLHEAVKEARHKLKLIENDLPNASWLPVIFQNPEEPPLFYPSGTNPPIWTIILWGIGAAIALSVTGLGFYKITELSKDSTLAPEISLGEEILSKNNTNAKKEAGVKAFAAKKYPEAIAHFKASLEQNPNDPETRIYLNNARVANNKNKIKVATSVPLGSNQAIAEEILRGVAEIQENVNREDGIDGKGLGLQIVIANDNNNSENAEEKARKFVKDPSIFAVIGHNASNASVAATPIYKKGKLVMISPTSFANQLGKEPYVFRLVPQITFFAAQLSNGLGKAITQPNVAICVDNTSPDQESFKNEFRSVVSAYRGQYIEVNCNFSQPNFNKSNVIAAIKKHNVNSLMVAPYVDHLPKAIAVFKEVRQNQLPVKLFGSPTLYNDKTIELGGEAVEGLTVSVPYYPDLKEQESFRELWKVELNTWRSSTSKDTTIAIVTALQELLKTSQPSREKLDDILRDPNFKVKGIAGEFKFNKKTGEREFLLQQQRPDKLIQVQNGKFVKVE
ncbi:ABC transporter substrate-binding protein [Phormidium sp. LEGE 05292]|uniref:ABC transporter substrate-binding protein n=1 Tax=[Phormidium] sp. LEGE 05292 TaxID=767427 RepID=UPI001881A3BD|nr:ABC transporter substrate-binding protein [Phormidium sp. LEGE 05292]MBE9229338.1 ABC transporter substrate-binding protein [Phormidium sp. LEGE 05292]